MIRDAYLTAALNQRPTITAGLLNTGEYALLLPNGNPSASPSPSVKVIDLGAQVDLGRGSPQGAPMVARFEVTTTFTGGDPNSKVRFFVAAFDDSVSPSTDLSLSNTVIAMGIQDALGQYDGNGAFLARSQSLKTANLFVGTVVELAIPALPPFATSLGGPPTPKGRRLIGLGMQVTALTADWATGGVNAFLLPATQAEITHYGSGFTV